MQAGLLKKRLLISLMVALSATALLAIVSFVSGGQGEIQGRLLGTTLIVALSSLTGLCAAIAVGHRSSRVIGVAGMATSGLAALLAIVVIWGEVSDALFDGTTLRLTFAAWIAAVAFAWCSLVLLASVRYGLTRKVVQVTVALVLLLGVILDVMILAELNPPQGFARFLGVLGVLALLGTFLAPILNKVLSMGESTGVDRATPPPAG